MLIRLLGLLLMVCVLYTVIWTLGVGFLVLCPAFCEEWEWGGREREDFLGHCVRGQWADWPRLLRDMSKE